MRSADHRLGVGILGPGNISGQYLETLEAAPDVEVRFIAARRPDAAAQCAARYGVPRWGSLDAMLADDSVELVVNLTTPQAHAETTRRLLECGRHVWSEKPLGVTLTEAQELLALADRVGVRLGCAPDTILGKGLQTALGQLRAGRIGAPTSAFACLQYGGPDLWHPNPAFLFAHGAGPVLDVGPYYVTALVQALGPVARVTARGLRTHDSRVVVAGPRAGERFPVEVDTHVSAILEFAQGAMATVIMSFDVPIERAQLEIGGTDGALAFPDPNRFDGDTIVHTVRDEGEVVAPGITGGDGRGSGVVDMARSIRSGTPHRADGRLALHVLEVVLAIESAAREKETVEVHSTVTPMEMLPEGWTTSEG